jgi:hypothetical protein
LAGLVTVVMAIFYDDSVKNADEFTDFQKTKAPTTGDILASNLRASWTRFVLT